MSLINYGVLVGAVVDQRTEGDADTPHYQIRVSAAGTDFRVAVNVLSQQAPSDLLFLEIETFEHPLLAQLAALPDGFTAVASAPGGDALDYIRGNLFDRADMRTLPPAVDGPDNDLADAIDHYVRRAAGDAGARIYAFGQRWPTEATVPDKVFGFLPGNGIHDIHMNQGNSGQFTHDDGVWQDGGLLLHFPSQNQWVAIFLAFQSQSWHTDDSTGHTIDAETPTDRSVRIVGALVNPIGPAPEAETVTLLNASADQIDLAGWALLDQLKHRLPLTSDPLPAGQAVRIPVQLPMQLGNHGGLITLLDAQGLKVDGVSYASADSAQEGWTVVF